MAHPFCVLPQYDSGLGVEFEIEPTMVLTTSTGSQRSTPTGGSTLPVEESHGQRGERGLGVPDDHQHQDQTHSTTDEVSGTVNVPARSVPFRIVA